MRKLRPDAKTPSPTLEQKEKRLESDRNDLRLEKPPPDIKIKKSGEEKGAQSTQGLCR